MDPINTTIQTASSEQATPTTAPTDVKVETSNVSQTFTNQPTEPKAIGDVSQEKSTGTEKTEESVEEKYEPNYKYKVYDKELEFDDVIKPLVTKENESRLRELYEKSSGIDFIKEKLEKTRGEYTQTQQQFNQFQSGVKRLEDAISSKDYDDAFNILGVDLGDLKEYIATKLQYEQLAPEERKAFDRANEDRRKAYMYEQQLSQLQQQNQEMLRERFQSEINQVVNRPEINKFVEAFNNKQKSYLGDMAGTNPFMSEIQHVGREHYSRYGVDLPVAQAVEIVLKKHGYDSQAQTNSSMSTKPMQKNKPEVKVITNTQNTLPNIGKSGAESPTGRKIKSIADLEQLSKDYAAGRIKE